ncbi:MAG: RluA family pseudouridine synthase, partial [Hyphomicrobiaceae bacterium]
MSDEKNAIIQLAVPEERRGLRVDRFIASQVDALSRQLVKTLIEAGNVMINDQACRDGGFKLRGGELIRVDVPPAAPIDVEAEEIPLSVVYEDDELIVIDKPAGLVTHPAPGHDSGTLVNALIAHAGASLSGIGGVKRPGIVHRLDKDTSGLLVVAKTDRAHRGLSEQFSAHGRDGRMERTYIAFVWGQPERRSGRISAALGRSPTNRRKIAVVPDARGRAAATNYLVDESFHYDGAIVVSSLRLSLETGRTHQIRVHMTSIGHP